MKRLLCAFALAAVSLFADVSGKWSGTFEATTPDGENKTETALLMLKQEGNVITGTAGPNEEKQFTVKKGSIDGNKLSLELESDEGQVFQMELTVDGDSMNGTLTGEHDGEKFTASLKVKRES